MRLLAKAPEALNDAERAAVEAICTAGPGMTTVRTLAAGVRRLRAERDVHALAPWLAATRRSV